MTDLQIRYFLAAARCLNFTDASKELYISQPALSQQITNLENELNIQLFIRHKGRVYLTPAATVLLNELPKYEEHYAEIIEKARIAHQGISQTLKIGLLEGQIITEPLLSNIFNFREEHPHVSIEFSCYSLGEALVALQENIVDLAYLPSFEVRGKEYLHSIEVAKNTASAYISVHHPLANQNITSLKQLQHETFLMLRETESPILYKLLINDFKHAGFTPNIKYVSSLDENILCTELGMGIGISNSDSYAAFNPNIVKLKNLKMADGKVVFAWKKENMNTAISLFVHSL